MTAPRASLRVVSSADEARALRMGLGRSEGVEEAEREIKDVGASSDMSGCESPRSTRLMEVGL